MGNRYTLFPPGQKQFDHNNATTNGFVAIPVLTRQGFMKETKDNMTEKRRNRMQARAGNPQTKLEKNWAELIRRFNALHTKVKFELTLDVFTKTTCITQIEDLLNVLNTQSPSRDVCKSAKRKLENMKKELGLSTNVCSR